MSEDVANTGTCSCGAVLIDPGPEYCGTYCSCGALYAWRPPRLTPVVPGSISVKPVKFVATSSDPVGE